MPKITLTDLEAGYGLQTSYNANNDAIEAAFDNTISRDGSTPNAMAAELDMNSNKIINVKDGVNPKDAANYGQLTGKAFSEIDVGDAPVVATIVAMQAILAPSNGDVAIVTEDGRAGTFVFDTSETGAANNGTTFKATDATIGSWVRRFSGPVDVRWFGAVGDGTTDDTTALQAALTFGSANAQSVFIPAGTYVISDTLEITSPTVSYQSAHVYGEGRGYSINAQTIIDASAVLTKPALHISAGSGVTLEDFAVLGPNFAPGTGSIVAGNHYYDAAWVTAGVRDSRYSPQCGVCVDGNTSTTPADGGYPGFTYKGTADASVDLTFNRVLFKQHVVGLMLCPSLSLNGDQISIRDCQFIVNKVAIAAGQAQTKATTISGGNVLRARTAYEGLEYGQQQGRGPVFFGTQFLK
jgi:hypothetical protein